MFVVLMGLVYFFLGREAFFDGISILVKLVPWWHIWVAPKTILSFRTPHWTGGAVSECGGAINTPKVFGRVECGDVAGCVNLLN